MCDLQGDNNKVIIIEVNQLITVRILGCSSESGLLRLLANGWKNFVPTTLQLCRIWQLRIQGVISYCHVIFIVITVISNVSSCGSRISNFC